MERNENKFGACPWCSKATWLTFVLGSKPDGGIWCGWVCKECLEKKQKQEWVQKDADRTD